MEFVKLKTTYYNDLAIMSAGELAEVLFTRALAFAGEQETDGFIPAAVVPRLTPTKTSSRVNALVREGLWAKVDDGWVIVGWEKHQTLKSRLDADREANRRRVQNHRANKRSNAVTPPVTGTATNGEVTRTEVEVEVEDAAAAASGGAEPPLPPPLQILRAALEAHKLVVSWARLTPEQVAEIERLVELHGDSALVQSALRAYQPNRPIAYAQGWIADWRALRRPGELAVVQPDPCELPGHTGSTRHCTQCASERLERKTP